MTDELLAAYRRGAERMRELCIAIAQPVGNYSNTPEMQERLKVRCEITDMIHTIDVDKEWAKEPITSAKPAYRTEPGG